MIKHVNCRCFAALWLHCWVTRRRLFNATKWVPEPLGRLSTSFPFHRISLTVGPSHHTENFFISYSRKLLYTRTRFALKSSCQDTGDATFFSFSGAALLDPTDIDHCTFWPSRISCSPCIMCATLTFGPLNHFLADRTHQMQIKNIGTPYTTTVQFITSACKFAPVTLGKQSIGTMSMTKAEAMMPMGMEKCPRFQGPGRKRLPTKKTRMKIGVVKALTLLDSVFNTWERKRKRRTRRQQ